MEQNRAWQPIARKRSSNDQNPAGPKHGPKSTDLNSRLLNKNNGRAGAAMGRKSAQKGSSSAPASQQVRENGEEISIGKSSPYSVMSKAGPHAPSILEQEPIELVVHWPAGSNIDDIYAQTYGMLGRRLQETLMEAAPSEAYGLIGKPRFAKRRVYPVGSQGHIALDVTLLVPAGCAAHILASPYMSRGRLCLGPVRLSPRSAPIEVEFVVKNFFKNRPRPWLVRGIPYHLVGSGVAAFLADVYSTSTQTWSMEHFGTPTFTAEADTWRVYLPPNKPSLPSERRFEYGQQDHPNHRAGTLIASAIPRALEAPPFTFPCKPPARAQVKREMQELIANASHHPPPIGLMQAQSPYVQCPSWAQVVSQAAVTTQPAPAIQPMQVPPPPTCPPQPATGPEDLAGDRSPTTSPMEVPDPNPQPPPPMTAPPLPQPQPLPPVIQQPTNMTCPEVSGPPASAGIPTLLLPPETSMQLPMTTTAQADTEGGWKLQGKRGRSTPTPSPLIQDPGPSSKATRAPTLAPNLMPPPQSTTSLKKKGNSSSGLSKWSHLTLEERKARTAKAVATRRANAAARREQQQPPLGTKYTPLKLSHASKRVKVVKGISRPTTPPQQMTEEDQPMSTQMDAIPTPTTNNNNNPSQSLILRLTADTSLAQEREISSGQQNPAAAPNTTNPSDASQ